MGREKVKMKSSPLLLSAFTDRSWNYLCWLWAHSSHRHMGHIRPRLVCAVDQKATAAAPAPERAKNPGPEAGASKLDTLYAKLCMVRNCQSVSGSGLPAKAMFLLPRMFSVEVHWTVLNPQWMTAFSPGSSAYVKEENGTTTGRKEGKEGRRHERECGYWLTQTSNP